MNCVWPRLPHFAAVEALEAMEQLDAPQLREAADLRHPDAAPVAVGGSAVPEERLRAVQTTIRALSDELGFPDELGRPYVARFDRPASRLLHHEMRIIPADAGAPDVWSFVSLVLLPDVAVWRFPDRARSRMLGHPRNVFWRLWARAETVGADLVDVEDGLGEDELVNIMERTSLAADRRVSRCLAQTVVERGREFRVARSELMRDAAKRVLRQQANLCLEALGDAEIRGVVDAAVGDAAVALVTAETHG